MEQNDKMVHGIVNVTNIDYDFDGEDFECIEAPTELEWDVTVKLGVDVSHNGEIMEDMMCEISDWVSEATGWCHNGFNATFKFA